MTENKQAICDSLCRTLQMTRADADIDEIIYDARDEAVLIMYSTGLVVKVNVACDSGIAMIQDIMKNVHY